MRYGFYLPTRGPTATRDGILALAREGERLGLHSAMIAPDISRSINAARTVPLTIMSTCRADEGSWLAASSRAMALLRNRKFADSNPRSQTHGPSPSRRHRIDLTIRRKELTDICRGKRAKA
jgi:hypothetical protein